MIEIYSKDYVKEQKEKMAERVEALKAKGIHPSMTTFLVKGRSANAQYAKVKGRFAETIGVDYHLVELDAETTTDDLVQAIEEKNQDPNTQGIKVEMPLPEHIDERQIRIALDPDKDVDALHPIHLGNLLHQRPSTIPNTPLAAMKMLELADTEFKGKDCVVSGNSTVVGRPLAELLEQKEATVTLCHIYTNDTAKFTREADIVCSATGVPHLVTEDMIKEGATVVDIGTTYTEEGKLLGDVDYENVAPKTRAITPVPGGVGPVTQVMLFDQMITRLEKEAN